MNKIFSLTSALALVGSIAVGGTTASAEVTLDVYQAWGSHAKRFYQPIADEFMKTHPDVEIVFRASAPNYDDGHLSIIRAAMTDNLPDVWFTGHQHLEALVHTLSARGQIAELTPFLSAEGEDWVKANYDPHVLELGQVDGKQWAMPFCASTPIVYYNLDLLQKAGGDPNNLPADWDGAIALAKKIHELGDGVDGLTLNFSTDDDWQWQALIFGYGGTMMNAEKTKVTFGDSAGTKAAQLVRRLVAETEMPLLNDEQGMQQFVAGKMGMFYGSTAEVRTMDDAIGGKFKVRTGKFPLGDQANGRLPTGGNSAVILAKDPEKRKVAWEFIKFATSPLGQKMVVLGSGYMPTNLQTPGPDFLGDFYKEHPNWTTSMKQWPIARPWFGYPGSNGVKVWREQSAIINAIAVGEVEPADGLKQMIEKTERLTKQ